MLIEDKQISGAKGLPNLAELGLAYMGKPQFAALRLQSCVWIKKDDTRRSLSRLYCGVGQLKIPLSITKLICEDID